MGKFVCSSMSRRRKMSNSVLVLVTPKEKVDAIKWTSTVHGKEVAVKDKVEHLKTFAPHDIPEK